MKAALAWLRHWWWILVAVVIFLVALFGRQWSGWRVRRRRSGDNALRRAHEARVDAQMAKRRIDADAEREIRQIREDLEADMGAIELTKADRAAALAKDADQLLEAYRRRASRLGR